MRGWQAGTPAPPTPDLHESLAWLDHCLGETEAAMAAVKAAMRVMRMMRMAGGDARPTGAYHACCEMAAAITIIRRRCTGLALVPWKRVAEP